MGYNAQIFEGKQNRLVGKLFLAQECGKIDAIDMPQDKNIVTITSQDLTAKKIKVLNDYFPVFAESRVDFYRQPVLAVFGPDIESVENFIKQIKLHVSESEVPKADHSVKYKHGDIDKYFKNPEKIISSDSVADAHCETLLSAQRVLAKTEDDIVYIKAASQWPIHVRDSVAIAMQKPKNKVYVISETIHAEYNQLVIGPSVASVIAASAAQKSGMLCELQITMSSWQPETHYHFETEVDEDNKILAHRVEVNINLGMFPIFVNEICNHIMTGLVPSYKTGALYIKINTATSNSHPAGFFADLGYGLSLAASENHFNYVLHKLHLSPAAWRTEKLTDSNTIRGNIRKDSDNLAIDKTVEEAAADSYFERIHSVYSQMSVKNKLGRSIMSYSRGIGIACGQGIQGFSNSFPYVSQYSATLTLFENRKVSVNLGLQMGRHLRKIYREIIQNYLDVDYQDISFVNINEENVKDAGPCVLSRGMSLITKIIDNACRSIKQRQDNGEKFPIIQESFYINKEAAPYFESHCCATVVVDLHIDTVRIIPVIDRVTARIKCGKVFDAQALSESIRHLIADTINEVCPDSENLAEIDLKIRSNPKVAPGSCSSLIRGITIASIITALSQALSFNIVKIPLSETDLAQILKNQGEHHAAELQN